MKTRLVFLNYCAPSKNRFNIYRYSLKYRTRKKPILFKEGPRIQKICLVGKFWLDAKTGEPTNVEKMWEPISRKTKEKYENEASPPVRKVRRNTPPVVKEPTSTDNIVEQPTSPICCPHSNDSDYEYCGQYPDCGQYPECRLPPPTFSTLPIPSVVEPPEESKESPPVGRNVPSTFVTTCTHFDDGYYGHCGQYRECGEYPECWLIPSELLTQLDESKPPPPVNKDAPPVAEQSNESKESPPVEKPVYPPHSTTRWIPARFVRDW